jgi:dynein heavy chain
MRHSPLSRRTSRSTVATGGSGSSGSSGSSGGGSDGSGGGGGGGTAVVKPGSPRGGGHLHDEPDLQWQQIEATGDRPPPRSGHSFTALGNTVYLFGGLSRSRPPAPNQDLYLLRMSTMSYIWSRVTTITGEPPSARWDHTATLFNGNQFLVFGGRVSRTNQNNETWVLDVMGEKWVCLFGTKPYQIGDNPRYEVPNIPPDVPAPRAGHSAANVKDRVFVFGGFGGFGYTREELCDLFVFDARKGENPGEKEMGDRQWHALFPDGKAPSPRSGHSCTVVADSKLFVFGGWNKSRQFNDLHIYDTEGNRWSNPDCNYGPSRWNHSSIAVESIPDAKLFVFGGSMGTPASSDSPLEGEFNGDLLILNTGPSKKWRVPRLGGTPPAPRASSPMAFDLKGSRLLFFGGWANQWLDDLFVLDVGSIVGPPYAVTGLSPSEGPITGGGVVFVEGIDFDNRPPIVVRFATREYAVDVPGTFVNATLVKCRVPDFSRAPGSDGHPKSNHAPAGAAAAVVQVRVSLRHDSFTTTFQLYRYFAVTHAQQCVAFGPALTDGARAKIPAMFVIAALDTNGKQRTTGGDQFSVLATYDDKVTGVPTTIRDNEDGTYTVKVTADRAEAVTIDINFEGSFGGVAGQLRGFPVRVQFEEPASTQNIDDRNNNRIGGELHVVRLRQQIDTAVKFARDTFDGIQREVDRNDLETLVLVMLNMEVRSCLSPSVPMGRLKRGGQGRVGGTQGGGGGGGERGRVMSAGEKANELWWTWWQPRRMTSHLRKPFRPSALPPLPSQPHLPPPPHPHPTPPHPPYPDRLIAGYAFTR